jgi:hypothetical protein
MGGTKRAGRYEASASDPSLACRQRRCKGKRNGQVFYHLKRMDPSPQANDPALQDRLIAICAEISGDTLPV